MDPKRSYCFVYMFKRVERCLVVPPNHSFQSLGKRVVAQHGMKDDREILKFKLTCPQLTNFSSQLRLRSESDTAMLLMKLSVYLGNRGQVSFSELFGLLADENLTAVEINNSVRIMEGKGVFSHRWKIQNQLSLRWKYNIGAFSFIGSSSFFFIVLAVGK